MYVHTPTWITLTVNTTLTGLGRLVRVAARDVASEWTGARGSEWIRVDQGGSALPRLETTLNHSDPP